MIYLRICLRLALLISFFMGGSSQAEVKPEAKYEKVEGEAVDLSQSEPDKNEVQHCPSYPCN